MVVGDSSALTLDDLALALADGDRAALDRAYGRALEEGSDAITILRAAGRHLLRLHQVASAPDAGPRSGRCGRRSSSSSSSAFCRSSGCGPRRG